MVVPIIKYGSSILRKHSLIIAPEENIQLLSDVLFDTLKDAGGIGLAAPQAGILLRAFVIDTSPLNDSNVEYQEKLYINPEIIWQSKSKVNFKEGCLSLPEIFEDVIRPEEIVVKYTDTSSKRVEEKLGGIIARIFQHEYDHLEGILFIDKINQLRRILIEARLNQLKTY